MAGKEFGAAKKISSDSETYEIRSLELTVI
jgi:hypothetical protein